MEIKKLFEHLMSVMTMKNKRGQVLAVPKEVVFGLGGLVIGILFIFLFISQMFTAIPIPTGSYESNASTVIRANYSVGVTSFSGSFATIGIVAGLIVIVIMLALAWRYFGNSGITGMNGNY